MSFTEFVAWVRTLTESGRLAPGLAGDVIVQRQLFDAQRQRIESDYARSAVGYVAGELIVASSVPGLMDRVVQEYPGRIAYFEPIGYRAF